MTSPILELGYLGFEVSDLARWDVFATTVLGIVPHPGPAQADGSATRYLQVDDQAYRFILSAGPADDYAFAGWRVADAAAVRSFVDFLKDKGIEATAATPDELALRRVEQMIHFQDPAGNRHEVYCGHPRAETQFKSDLVPSGFVTAGGGLGHVVYEAADYPAMVKFAEDVLGLRLSDFIDMRVGPGITVEVAFFHANERHHSFAVAPRPPVPGPHKRIHHFMLEARTMREVGFARDRFLQFGLDIPMDIGQHPNDRMISFYGKVPSGFHIEFGFGGVFVDDATWQSTRYDGISEWGHRPAAPLPAAAAAPEVKA
jgi:biphenyl-2,3-diol 1,2-dioxygenase